MTNLNLDFPPPHTITEARMGWPLSEERLEFHVKIPGNIVSESQEKKSSSLSSNRSSSLESIGPESSTARWVAAAVSIPTIATAQAVIVITRPP